ncbi:MAG: MFS transporter [Atopobium sp.]|nr:MFS transporter [Atopobium sp.]
MFEGKLETAEKNILFYKWSNYINSSVLIWTILTLYYLWRGLSYFDIALVQSVGAIATAVLEIPTGWISDRCGHHIVLKIASFSRLVAIVTLTFANSFLLMVASELFFSLANASQSGAGSAFLFEATNANSRMDRKNGAYALILSKMTGAQSIIRITVRLIAPVLFSINPLIPFVISIFVYFLGLLVTLEFKENDVSPNRRNNCLPEEDEFIRTRTSKLNLKEAVQTFFQELIKIVKTNIFISLCTVSAISLILVSNYSQFIAPNLTNMGFDIKFLGIVTAAASLGEFFGSRLTAKIVKTLKDSYKKSAEDSIAFSGNVEFLVILGVLSVIAVLILCAGLIPSIYVCIFTYVAINLFSTTLSILINNQMNLIAEENNRATLLSVSNQIEEIASVVSDPLIGVALDLSGFGTTYIGLGCITLVVIAFIFSIHYRKYR